MDRTITLLPRCQQMEAFEDLDDRCYGPAVAKVHDDQYCVDDWFCEKHFHKYLSDYTNLVPR
ncbi:hypothetical protein MGALJ_39600 [Mycobacterium gallinarum]|uniref:Uncharacterized protein n=1 Tax=Mycobacterium gallinarum TaxID=39689 RepID=A0A9W4B525_9MYCO|nr:hypothetical protein [Mycobacterium gallinarum]BBY94291.1 hypothetical protein MGALJ_39600 [Mycobacterium gallinarum]